MTGAGAGTEIGGSVVVIGWALSCSRRYKKKGTKSSNKIRGTMHVQMFDLILVAAGTISKSPAPWPTYVYVVFCL